MRDRIGMSWRPELAAGILTHLDRVDVVEVMADDLFDLAPAKLRAFATLAAQIPVILHGVSLGLASSEPADPARLQSMARVVTAVRPESWSEHLAFVRAGGTEIGHLAAPPRTDANIEGSVANLARARAAVGAAPLVENIATLMEPPGSQHSEATWIAEILRASGCRLLLDLHNLHANATNYGYDPLDFLGWIPLDRVEAIHLAGGTSVVATTGETRVLDDHLHDVPDVVYRLLTEVAARVPRPLTVILERDGAYPPFDALLAQLDLARAAVERGRIVAAEGTRP